MILEQIVIDILKEELPKYKRIVKWDGMYDRSAKRIVKAIKEEIVKYWDLRKEIGGGVVKVRLDTKLGERMYLNWIKEKSVYLNIMYVLNVIRKERQQEYYMLTTSTVGINSLNSDTRDWMVSWCVLSVIMVFTESINSRLSINPTCYLNMLKTINKSKNIYIPKKIFKFFFFTMFDLYL